MNKRTNTKCLDKQIIMITTAACMCIANNELARETISGFTLTTANYHMEGSFGKCKLWQNGKENIIGGINFGSFIVKV